MKKILLLLVSLMLSASMLYAQEGEGGDTGAGDTGAGDTGAAQEQAALDYAIGGIFGAVTIDGMNYQQIGMRPEIKLWKLALGLDLNILIDDNGELRKEDWDSKEDYIDKIYYIKWGEKGDPFYFKYGGLDSTTLGFGTLIYGYTNMLEYPTYKRQGLEIGFKTDFMGVELIANDVKELLGKNRAVMGGGRIYITPFSRLQIGGSIAGDLNEYKGLRDTDGDGIPDEVDAYPDDDKYATEIDRYRDHGIDEGTITLLTNEGLISPVERDQLMDVNQSRSMTGFWAGDIGLSVLDMEFIKMAIYAQYAMCFNTGGWGYTVPGVRMNIGPIVEVYADYRQQSDEFIFSYYNDTYDLERAKYVDTGTEMVIQTKKDRIKATGESKGYLAGIKINILNIATGKLEYQDMQWGDVNDKSIRGDVELKKNVIPMVSKVKAYYTQTNVEKFTWKSESTVMGAVIGIGMSDTVSIDFKYLITYEDKNGDGDIRGGDETISNVSVSTSTTF